MRLYLSPLSMRRTRRTAKGPIFPSALILPPIFQAGFKTNLSDFKEKLSHQRAPIPARLPPSTLLFDVPDKLSKILNRDLKRAGIPKRDDRGRMIDVHSLRHTFGSMLSRGGVAPRTAQAAMRHSKIDLTMNVYTDPALLDIRGALDALPTLALSIDHPEATELEATGTEGTIETCLRSLAPLLAPVTDLRGQSETLTVTTSREDGQHGEQDPLDVTSIPVNGKDPLTVRVRGSLDLGATGFEPVTPSVSSWCSSQLS